MKGIFPQRLKASRKLRKMNQDCLAARSGLQRSVISRFESGSHTPSFNNLNRLADALTVTADYLLGRAEKPGASGPEAGSLFRHAENFSAEDLKTLESMARLLAEKNKPKEIHAWRSGTPVSRPVPMPSRQQ
jgi:transcriptional regulator with XRE-family HTH domain